MEFVVYAKLVLLLAITSVVLSNGAKVAGLCNVTEEGMSACRPSVTPPNPVTPSPECCDAASGADFKCLCSYRNSFMLPSLGIDPDLVLALPAKCGLSAPDTCEGS
ncbi:hypothetical protein F511_10258 [Dorcoceras hygrometricum]|uniref:Bifunctional inhibitor/plant lipid transfer protein/seed storage helical domain-containing protein n=1 Tax=Dorcoceras hygrometricum TaxID=472368 RepID=A0A2Z7A9V2_9LAMI|nr:hypothetical protein F511_10258 [Dorcoceras hygrometricum]